MFVPKPYDPFGIGRLLDYLVSASQMPRVRKGDGALPEGSRGIC